MIGGGGKWGKEKGVGGKRGLGENRRVVYLCAEESTLVFVGVGIGNEKGTCRLRIVST